jgi:hypothetical protein
VSACSAGGNPDKIVLGGTGTPVEHTGTSSTQPTTPPPADPAMVRVRVESKVAQSPATKALIAFAREHARSLIEGEATVALSEVTGGPLFNYQLRVVSDAVRKQWVVSQHPRLRVVSAEQVGRNATLLSVCFWGPSVGYRDSATNELIAGSAPGWAAANAMIERDNTGGRVSWVVAKVSAPTSSHTVECGD